MKSGWKTRKHKFGIKETYYEQPKVKSKEERELIQLNSKEMNSLKDILGIKQNKCYYCKEKIDFKKDKYSIFNKPTRLICNSLLCLTEAIESDKKEAKQLKIKKQKEKYDDLISRCRVSTKEDRSIGEVASPLVSRIENVIPR